jgi:tripartite-type tricarboxylate transporter receptor subunit TctC
MQHEAMRSMRRGRAATAVFRTAALRTALAALLCAACALPAAALAQGGERPLRVILPVGPGSGVDTMTRAIGPALGRALGGQAVVIENQPGAGGIPGTLAMIKSAPDGNTISLVSNNHVIYPSVYKSLPFDPIADITPVAVVGTTPMVLVVNPARVPAKNAGELIAFFKAAPGKYNYASSGSGTILHLAAAMFVDQAGVDVRHIPYKGVGPMLADTIGGQVEMSVAALPSVQGHLKAGLLRAIGVGGSKRVAAAPEIPTLAEQGLPQYNMEAWIAVIAPAGLPPEQLRRLHGAVAAAFAAPDVREAMAKQGNSIEVGTPEAAAQFFKSELLKYARLTQKVGVRLD